MITFAKVIVISFFRYFPFDTQTCFLKFGSWTSDHTNIYILPSENQIITSSFTNSSEWKIKSGYSYIYLQMYPISKQPFSEIKVYLTIARKPLYYLFNVITPCLVLVTTIFIGFYLPPDCGERVSLTITILLAVAVFLQLITDHLPTNSDSVPILAVFYIVMMTESAVSLITTCIILIVHHKSNEIKTQEIPGWIRKIFLEKMAYFFNMRKKVDMDTSLAFRSVSLLVSHLRSPKSSNTTDSDIAAAKLSEILNEIRLIRQSLLYNQPTNEAEERQEEWRFLAKVLDRFFFWVFLVTVILTTICILVPTYLITI